MTPLVLAVNLAVHTQDADRFARFAEVVARTAAGLMLDGADINLTMLQFEPDEDDQ